MTVTAIVLAAGQGSRFRAEAGSGEDKLLALCVGRDGVERTVIEQVLMSLPPHVEQRWLVTSPDRADVIRLAQKHGCAVLRVESPGMGDSIAAGVAASPSSAGWLVVLGDMPFILPCTSRQVVAALEENTINVPVHKGQYGHPVAFGRSFGPALLALNGDRGAKPLFAQGCVREIPVDDPGILWDVDVPELLHYGG
ncbi:nucleotidyltransferase family protein [Pseudomonas graminis]